MLLGGELIARQVDNYWQLPVEMVLTRPPSSIKMMKQGKRMAHLVMSLADVINAVLADAWHVNAVQEVASSRNRQSGYPG